MIALARKTLIHEWRRFVPSVFAVGFSGVLLAMQAALVLGIFGSAAIYVTASSADLWAIPALRASTSAAISAAMLRCACAWTPMWRMWSLMSGSMVTGVRAPWRKVQQEAASPSSLRHQHGRGLHDVHQGAHLRQRQLLREPGR